VLPVKWLADVPLAGGLQRAGPVLQPQHLGQAPPGVLRKQWTQAELDALFSKKMSTGDNLILPIWHRVTKDQVQTESPLLAGILALNTSLMTVGEIFPTRAGNPHLVAPVDVDVLHVGPGISSTSKAWSDYRSKLGITRKNCRQRPERLGVNLVEATVDRPRGVPLCSGALRRAL
jgi:hypothetical protein